MTKTSFLVILALFAGSLACKPRKSGSELKLEDSGGSGDLSGVSSGLKDFALEPTGAFPRKLGARLAAADQPAAGCAHAARYAVTGAPGKQKSSWGRNRGELVGSIQQVLKGNVLSWDKFEEWVTLPTYTFLACKGAGGFPGGDEVPKDVMAALKGRGDALKADGLKLTLVVVTGEEAKVTNGALTAVKAALEGSAVGFRDVAVAAEGGLEAGVAAAQTALGKDLADTDVLAIWAYGVAGPIVLHAMGGDGGDAQKLRNRTAVLVTVGSPIGGALPAIAAQKEVTRAFEKIAKRSEIVGIANADDAVFKAVMRPADWLTPEKRAAALNGLKGTTFALARSEAQKKALGDKVQIAHVAAIQDPTNLRFFPRMGGGGDNGGAKLGLNDIAAQLLMPLYQKFPLSDGVVALEHAVIPTNMVPEGVEARLVGVLRLSHFDLALSGADATKTPGRRLEALQTVPALALVDSLFAAAFEAIDKKETAKMEEPAPPPVVTGPSVVVNTTPQANDGMPHNGWRIKSKYSDMCLDVPDKNKDYVYAHPCHGEVNQRWLIEPRGDTYVLKNLLTGKCIDTHTGDKQKKAGYVYMFGCHEQYNQVFSFGRRPELTLPRAGMPWSEIHNGLFGNMSCLDIDTSAKSAPNGNKNGRRVYFHTDCHGGDNQQWILDPG